MNQQSDTIFALATAYGQAGIAVLRLSGPNSLNIINKLNKNKILTPNQARLCWLIQPKTSEKLDQAILLYFEGPHSFTGEDVVEIHCHGGTAVTAAISNALLLLAARPAEPGEFTRRAFDNGRLDLVQAEGLADIIAAETEGQRKQALSQMQGSLSETIAHWRSLLLACIAPVEAEIDFSDEEDVEERLAQTIMPNLQQLRDGLKAQIKGADTGQKIRQGFLVALIGPVNAGKSTLLNKLAGEERAIVSALPGTTRDVVRADLQIAGHKVTLADTAGLREQSQDEIEIEGIRRSYKTARAADLRIFLQPADFLQTSNESTPVPHKVDADLWQPGDLTLISKADLLDGPLTANSGQLSVSGKSGAGVTELLHHIETVVLAKVAGSEWPFLTRKRHLRAMQQAHDALMQVETALQAGPELAAEHLRATNRHLLELVGAVDTEEVLGEIFSRFCIGK